MRYEMKLQPEPFELIKRGEKRIEMRLYDERRRPLKVGDEIEFTENETGEKMIVKILALTVYPSFRELYMAYPKEWLGYREDETADPGDMEKYYPPERQAEYGALAIEIERI